MHGVERGCVRQRRRWARARAAGAKGLYGVAYRTSSMADSKESNIYEQNRIAAAIKRSGFEEQLFYLIKNNHVQGIEHLFHKWQKQQQKTPMYKLKSMIMCCGLCRTSPSPVNLKIIRRTWNDAVSTVIEEVYHSINRFCATKIFGASLIIRYLIVEVERQLHPSISKSLPRFNV